MSVRFKGPTLRAVLVEALVNECRIILVKDQGVYFMAEHGEQWPNGRQKRLAYAFGCNPGIDSFDGWWELARTEFGGDDFGEFFDPQDGVFALILSGEGDLEVSATATHLSLHAVTPAHNGNWQPLPHAPFSGASFCWPTVVVTHFLAYQNDRFDSAKEPMARFCDA